MSLETSHSPARSEETVKYGHRKALARDLNICETTLEKRLKGVEGIPGMTPEGHLVIGYAEERVRELCADLLAMPKADAEKGLFTHNGERYGYISSWEKVLGISQGALQKRLANIPTIKGRDSREFVREFYAEADVRRECADLLQNLPQADDKGFFSVEGVRFAHILGWSRALEAPTEAMRTQLKGVEGITGRDCVGKILVGSFYPEPVIMEKCSDLQGLMKRRVRKTGQIELEGTLCVAIVRHASRIGINYKTLESAIEEAGIKPVGDALSHSQRVYVYPKSEIDKLAVVIRAQQITREKVNNCGVVLVGGAEGIVVKKYAEANGLDKKRLQESIDAAILKTIGTARRGVQIVDVYSKAEVETLPYVKERLEHGNYELANDGTVMLKGRLCVGINRYAEKTGLNATSLQGFVDESRLEVIGRVSSGSNRINVYEKAKVDTLPYVVGYMDKIGRNRLDTRGICILEAGETVGLWKYAKTVGMTGQALEKLISEASLQSVGHALSGKHAVNLFNKLEVDALIAQLPDEELNDYGVTTLNDREVIGINSYSRAHGLMVTHLSNELTKYSISPIGKAWSRNVLVDVYPKDEVEKLEYVQDRVVNRLPIVNDNGEVEIAGDVCVALTPFARAHQMHDQFIRLNDLMPVGFAFSGGHKVPVYRKSDIVQIPYVSTRLTRSEGILSS